MNNSTKATNGRVRLPTGGYTATIYKRQHICRQVAASCRRSIATHTQCDKHRDRDQHAHRLRANAHTSQASVSSHRRHRREPNVHSTQRFHTRHSQQLNHSVFTAAAATTHFEAKKATSRFAFECHSRRRDDEGGGGGQAGEGGEEDRGQCSRRTTAPASTSPDKLRAEHSEHKRGQGVHAHIDAGDESSRIGVVVAARHALQVAANAERQSTRLHGGHHRQY